MIRTYEAGIGIMILLIALIQFVMFSAGRLGEQWDSTELDVEVKKALQGFQSGGISDTLEKYSKIRDSDLLRMPDSEAIGYRVLVNGYPVDKTVPPNDAEVATADARIYHLSRDAPRLVRSFWNRLRRSPYVPAAGSTMDHESVDELADLILGLIWNEDSLDIALERTKTLIDNRNDDGGWGFVYGEESDVLCTSMAVRALSAWIIHQGGDPLANSTVTDGILWLKNRVHADGGYGARERIESSVDMTAYALLAYLGAGLPLDDQWVSGAKNFLLRVQRPDGGFPTNRRSRSDASSTAVAIEALMEADVEQSTIEDACEYLESTMIAQGNFTLEFTPLGGTGTYDITLHSGYIVDCSPRGNEFWGEHFDDAIVGVTGVYGDRNNMTVVLRIERARLVPPDNKQKIALSFSHNMTPDDTDWWILNAGNPHTAGGGVLIDNPQFGYTEEGQYAYLTITDLQVPDEYDFFNESEDWLIAVIGDVSHPIKDNPGWGYLVGYWNPWIQLFEYNNILAWRAWSPRVNRVCLDVDSDWEYDDRRLTDGDTVVAKGHEWQLSIWENATAINLTFRETTLNYTRWYFPLKYDLSSIPESKSGLYHYGVISVINKPGFSKDYKVILRDSVWEGVYDQAYIYNGTHWNLILNGGTWVENGTQWIMGIEGDFLTLTRSDPILLTGLSGRNITHLSIDGDFLTIDVERNGPKEIWLSLYQNGQEVDRAVFADSLRSPYREVFWSWGGLRETSKVYEALNIAEDRLTAEGSAKKVHDVADLCQQSIKFNKVYNSVIEDKLTIEAWYQSEGGG